MKIRITTDELVPRYSRNDEPDLPPHEAVPLLQAGYAEAVVGPVPEAAVQPDAARQAVEADLTAMGVYFLRGADMDSLIDLLGRSKAPAKPDPLDHDGNGKRGGSRKPVTAAPPADHQSEGL